MMGGGGGDIMGEGHLANGARKGPERPSDRPCARPAKDRAQCRSGVAAGPSQPLRVKAETPQCRYRAVQGAVPTRAAPERKKSLAESEAGESSDPSINSY